MGNVDFKNMESWEWVAIGEGVQAGTEDDVLGDACGDGGGEIVFGIAAAGDHVGAEGAGSGVGVTDRIGEEFRAKDGNCDGVVEEDWPVQKLVSCATAGDCAGSHADAACLHCFSLRQALDVA